jgi:hypothetical protein
MEIIKRLAPLGLVALLFVFLALQYILLELGTLEPKSAASALDYRWRLYWGLSSVFLLTALSWSYIVSISIIRNHPSKSTKYVLYIATVIAIIVGIWQPEISGKGGQNLINTIADNTNVPLNMIINFHNTFAGLCLFMMVFSVAILLLMEDKNTDINKIKICTSEIHNSLNSNSVLLVFGLVEIYCLFKWSTSFSGDSTYIILIADSIPIAAGFLFSFILALTYLPLLSARKRWLLKVVSNHNFQKKEDLDDWYATNYIEQKTGVGAAGIIVLALPLLTGIFVNIISEILTPP